MIEMTFTGHDPEIFTNPNHGNFSGYGDLGANYHEPIERAYTTRLQRL